jgi:hypothetical protein
MFEPFDFQQHLERPVDYWRDFGHRCAVHLQQQTTIPFRKGEIDGFTKRVLACMTVETGLRLSPERAQAFAEGMREACTKGTSSP